MFTKSKVLCVFHGLCGCLWMVPFLDACSSDATFHATDYVEKEELQESFQGEAEARRADSPPTPVPVESVETPLKSMQVEFETELAWRNVEEQHQLKAQLRRNAEATVDVVLILDSSGSMSDNSKKVREQLASLFQQIKSLDWRLRIASTDLYDACDYPVLSRGDKGYLETYRQVIDRIIEQNGQRTERGIESAEAVLQCEDGWLREESAVAVIIVSDEDNCSNGWQNCDRDRDKQPPRKGQQEGGSRNLKAGHPDRLVQLASDMGRDSKNGLFQVYSLVGTSESKLDKVQGREECTVARIGQDYLDIAERTGGFSSDICSENYAQIFKEIGSGIMIQTIGQKVTLKETPYKDSLQVRFEDRLLKAGVHYELMGNVVHFLGFQEKVSQGTAVFAYKVAAMGGVISQTKQMLLHQATLMEREAVVEVEGYELH
ncbi:MAG: VWA domain-containing protein [Zetaproteobacteria bacterium]|nr:VWA domain-containing protein [Zetaproteobacteria bacterium]